MNTATSLPFTLDRTVVIRATPAVVFSFFTDTPRWARWWGEGSSIDPRPGGRVVIRYPTGDEAVGEVIEIDAPKRIVFSYGYARGTPIAPGGSRVVIRLEPVATGTKLTLEHAVDGAAVRDEHVQGWRFQLALFANAVSDVVHHDAASIVDEWFRAWAEPDAKIREASLRRLLATAFVFGDQFSMISGIDELLPHVAASQRFMPGIRLRRTGDVRRSRDTVLVDWAATTADGQTRGSGTNLFELDDTNRIAAVTGFWNAQPTTGTNQ
jgi:uncharacterized protein YndB with AHSA1/START domain